MHTNVIHLKVQTRSPIEHPLSMGEKTKRSLDNNSKAYKQALYLSEMGYVIVMVKATPHICAVWIETPEENDPILEQAEVLYQPTDALIPKYNFVPAIDGANVYWL